MSSNSFYMEKYRAVTETFQMDLFVEFAVFSQFVKLVKCYFSTHNLNFKWKYSRVSHFLHISTQSYMRFLAKNLQENVTLYSRKLKQRIKLLLYLNFIYEKCGYSFNFVIVHRRTMPH